MKKLSKKQWERYTKEQNERFLQMPDAQKRVAVAKDTLISIDLGLFKPTNMTYVENRKEEESCNVCAIGSAFVSAARLSDEQLDFSGLTNRWSNEGGDLGGGNVFSTKTTQKAGFSEKMLHDMEAAFENWGHKIGMQGHIGDFWEAHNSEERLRHIMENIITNDGEFVVDQLPRKHTEPKGWRRLQCDMNPIPDSNVPWSLQ